MGFLLVRSFGFWFESVDDELAVSGEIGPVVEEVIVTGEDSADFVCNHVEGFGLVGSKVVPVSAATHNRFDLLRRFGVISKVPVG